MEENGMIEAAYHFPKGFLWGSATASHQVEGNNKNNNWFRWENEPGKIHNGDKSGEASGWWGGKWKEDFSRAAETGQNAHRLSIEWSRVQPKPDRWDESAIERYRAMVRRLVQLKMTPMITLHHFTDPLWFTDMGGWENAKAPQLFETFVRKIVEALKEYVTLWVTINEPNVYTGDGYIAGVFPPGRSDISAAVTVYTNLAQAHARAYRAIHALQKDAKVGIAMNHVPMHPLRPWFLPDRWMSNFISWNWNDAFPHALTTGTMKFLGSKIHIPGAAGTMDYFGFNYYFIQNIAFSPKNKELFYARREHPAGAERSPTGDFCSTPLGMFESLKWAKSFGLPIYITENGIEDEADLLRPRYLLEHIHQVWRGTNFNWQVKGYFHWSLVDNFEWLAGWSQRFGLWGLDIHTQERTKRRSAEIYEAICKENGITSDLVNKHAPEIFSKIFPV
jgi:beta-glucosidase